MDAWLIAFRPLVEMIRARRDLLQHLACAAWRQGLCKFLHITNCYPAWKQY
jgi:hypothetical protein